MADIKEKITNPSFNTWFSETKAVLTTEENQLILQVPNNFIQEWIESQYTDLIEEILADLTGNQWTLILLTPKEVKKFKEKKENNNNNLENEEDEEDEGKTNVSEEHKKSIAHSIKGCWEKRVSKFDEKPHTVIILSGSDNVSMYDSTLSGRIYSPF